LKFVAVVGNEGGSKQPGPHIREGGLDVANSGWWATLPLSGVVVIVVWVVVVVVVDKERLKHSKTSFGKLIFEVAEVTGGRENRYETH
jgi:hypothetical protein